MVIDFLKRLSIFSTPLRLHHCANNGAVLFIYSWVAQSVEQMAVNHKVVGSSPTSGANGDLTQQVECLPYKQEVIGSSPVIPTNGCVAQLVEQQTLNLKVAGSKPSTSTICCRRRNYYIRQIVALFLFNSQPSIQWFCSSEE